MGETKDWGRHEGAVVVLRRPDDKIYLAQRLSQDRPFAGCYAAPGGSVEEGETPLWGAARELWEETGLGVADADGRFIFLARTGPHLTPVEQGGSGKPYMMSYFGLDLLEGEKPVRTEPKKQGPWEAKTYGDWILNHVLVPGFDTIVEKMHRTKRRAA